jgi:hypothetical protein
VISDIGRDLRIALVMHDVRDDPIRGILDRSLIHQRRNGRINRRWPERANPRPEGHIVSPCLIQQL